MNRTIRWGLWTIVVIAILWTGVWFGARWWLGNTVHKSIADLSATNGTTVECPNEAIGGWPFQLTITCGDGLAVALPDGGKLTSAKAHGEGSVFNPRQLDFRFAAPITYTTPDGRRFDLVANELAASIGFSNNRANRLALKTSDLAATGPLAGGTEGKLTIGRGDLLLSRVAERPDDADIAATIDGLGVAVGNTTLTPVPVRLTLAATLAEADMATAGPAALAGWKAAGGKLALHRLAAELGGATLTLTGEGTVSETGLVEAEGKVTGRDLNALAIAAAAGGRSLTPEVAGLVMGFVFMGTAADDGGRSIGLKVADGVVSANGREIARIAPLF
ncbi:DUF2125 domain-containing protein [Pleomorphomonas oryzae]|uniref:DUF2125 domain-containing protein n=1 Tax=Pleomorphomonas oryzae TaxID=261934 RepID=UPI00041F6F90|nr:DUF2125 domain-containing protein [Pleomorphomonas oryzae]